MSRTYRNTKYANLNAREIAHYNYRRNELAALEELIDEGFTPDNRLASAMQRIANNYDDHTVSAYYEVYHD